MLPPSPQIPLAISDLKVIEHGDQLLIAFSTPARTTDNLAAEHFSHIDLRIGPDVRPFDYDRWAANAKSFEVALPPPTDPDNPLPISMTRKVPAAEWTGKRIAVAVRTAIKKNDHYSAWSNRVALDVIPPLTAPALKRSATAKGILLTWNESDGAKEYRIYRKTTDTAPVQLATTQSHEFLDTSAQYDTSYIYTAVAVNGLTESDTSKPESFQFSDNYGPAAPAGVTALAAPNSIELSWQRNSEGDFKSYQVYRSVDGGPFQAIGTPLVVPAFSDHQVEHGKTYRYRVGAFDQKNNASDKSSPVQVSY